MVFFVQIREHVIVKILNTEPEICPDREKICKFQQFEFKEFKTFDWHK